MRRAKTITSILAFGMLAGSAVGVAAQDAAPLPAQGALEPGTYVDDASLGPEVRFAVGDDWRVGHAGSELIRLSWGGTGQQLASITVFDGRVNAASCYLPEEGLEGDLAVMDVFAWLVQPENVVTLEATQAALWEHFAANPYLEIVDPTPVLAGGREGRQADVIASAGNECFEESTFLWYTPYEGAWEIANGERARFTTFDVGDRVVIVDARTTAAGADHEAFLGAMDELVASLTFTEQTDQ